MQHYPLLFNCCFIASVPKLWNDLPLKIRMAKSVDTLKKFLKTHLFSKAFHS